MKSRSGACTEPSATRHQAPWALPWGSRGPIRRGHDTIGARAQLQGWAPGPWARRSPPTACGVGWAAHTAAASRAAVHPLAASTAQGRQMADVRQLQPLMLLCAEGHQIVHSLPTLLPSAACSLVNEEYKLWKKNSPFLVSAAADGLVTSPLARLPARWPVSVVQQLLWRPASQALDPALHLLPCADRKPSSCAPMLAVW